MVPGPLRTERRSWALAVVVLATLGFSTRAHPQQPQPQPLPRSFDLPTVSRPGHDRYGDRLPVGAVMRLGSYRRRIPHPGMSVQLWFDQGRLFAGTRVNFQVSVLDVLSGEIVEVLPRDSDTASFAVSPDRRVLARGCGGVLVRERDSTKWLRLPQPPEPARPAPPKMGMGGVGHAGPQAACIAIDGASRLLVAALRDGRGTHLWDLATGERLHTFGEARCNGQSVSLALDGTRFACTTAAGVEVWGKAGTLDKAFASPQRPTAAALSGDGRTVALAGSSVLELFELESGRRLHALQHELGAPEAVAVSPELGVAALAAGSQIALWNLRTGQRLPSPPGHTGRVNAVAFVRDDTAVASGGAEGAVLLWDVATGERLLTLLEAEGAIRGLAPDRARGQLIVAANGRGNVRRVHFLGTSDEGGAPRVLETTGEVGQLAVHEAGGWVAVAHRTVSLHRFAAEGPPPSLGKKDLARLEPSALEPGWMRLALSGAAGRRTFDRVVANPKAGSLVVGYEHDDNVPLLLTQGEQGRVLSLKLPGTRPAHRSGLAAAAFSRDGKRLATAARGSGIHLWDAGTGQFLGCHAQRVSALTFDGTGERLVAGTEAGELLVLPSQPARSSRRGDCAATRARTLRGHLDGIEDLALSASGKRIASASRDGTVMVWRLP